MLNSQAPKVLSFWQFIKRETFKRQEISMIEKGMNKWMNKSCFAFLELSFLSSVQQIWKKQFFLEQELEKKKKETVPNLSEYNSCHRKHCEIGLLFWVITINTFCFFWYFIFILFIRFWKLRFGPDWNSLLFYTLGCFYFFIHWCKYFHIQINFFHMLKDEDEGF